jgi:hypothetical protein
MPNDLQLRQRAELLQKSVKGRPAVQIDEVYVYELAKLQCTVPEIAILCGCSENTIHRRYGGVVVKGQEEAKKDLRKAMIRSALSGNVIMQIWLSKNWLGFKERQPDEAPNTVINIQMNDIP